MAKWLDKYEQGGLVLKKKTKDNYGKKANPNDVQASVGPDFVGLGYNTKGRDYSPAWGGQFQDGGSIPTDKKSQKFYNTLKDYYTAPGRSEMDKAKYAAFNKLNEQYGYAPVGVKDRTIVGKRSMINPFSGRLNLVAEADPEIGEIKSTPQKLMDQYLEEYSHYQQYNQNPEESKLKKTGKFLGHMAKDFGQMIKNTKGLNFKKGYDKNYNTPGTTEYEAHRVIQPKLKKELEMNVEQDMQNRMAMGGALPGAVGFTYARTAGSVPANGKYTKKTKASAQLGIELMPYLLSSAASTAASIPTMEEVKGKAIDVIKNSPKIRSAINKGISYVANTDWGKEKIKNFANNIDPHGYGSGYLRNWKNESPFNRIYSAAILNKKEDSRKEMDSLLAAGAAEPGDSLRIDLINQYAGLPQKYNTVKPSAYKPTMGNKNDKYYSSPIVERQILSDIDLVAGNVKMKPEFKTKQDLQNFIQNHFGMEKGKGSNYVSMIEGLGSATYGIGEDKQGHYLSYYDNWDLNPYHGNYADSDNSFEATNDKLGRAILGNEKEDIATKKIGTPTQMYGRIYFDKKTGKPKMQNGGEMSFYQNGLDFKPKTISKNGSVIKDDRGQWAHPGEVTEIGSNDITMQGVDYPVLGISDTGDTQMMYPDQDYKFDGEKVTEFPMAQNGGWLDKYQDGGNINKKLKEEAEERLARMNTPKATISQYTPEPGEQAKFDKQKLQRIAEDNAPLNRMAASKGARNMQDAIEAALIMEGGMVAGKLIGKGAKAAGKYLTEETALKNAYKLNPYAFKADPTKYYRQAGKAAYDDAMIEGKMYAKGQKELLEKNPNINYTNEYNASIAADEAGKFHLTKPANAPFVQKGKLFYPIDRKPTGAGYKGTKFADAEYLFEGALPDEAVLPRYQEKYLSSLNQSGGAGVVRPEFNDLDNFKTYQKNWLKGYKEIPENKSIKVSEIDWGKWNPEIPKNKKLMEEYIDIENSTKGTNTWMKNPDGSEFKGTPEQFVQQQSQNFKKAFGNSKLVNPDGSPIMLYHGAPQKFNFFNPELFQRGDAGYSGVGIYTTPSKTTADSYAYSSRSFIGGKEHVPTVYELYGQANNPISAEELINEGGKRDLFNFNRQANWKGEVPVEERLTGYDAAIANTHPNVSRVRPWNEAYEIVFPTNTQLKSAVGNDGMFNMNNPNIYKALIPAIGTAGIVQASQKKNGGWLNKYK